MNQRSPIIFLRGDSIGMGPLRSDLVTTYQRWVNTLQVTRTLMVPCRPLTEEGEQAWLDSALTSSTDAVFTMYELTTMRPIGNAGLHNIDHLHGIADFGIVIGEPDAWGKGYGTEATRLMLAYGFDVLGLHNIQLEVYAYNPAAQRAYERAGFKRIGVRRGAVKAGRERYDAVYMDATADEFEPSPFHYLMQDGTPV